MARNIKKRKVIVVRELYQELADYQESDYYPFHMPGHKRNAGGGESPLPYGIDVTEIEGFDDLHQPHGIIAEAQKRAARLYRSEETFFLINGSTCGILSAVSAIGGKGDRILMSRNCHRSVYHAVSLRELEVCYLYPSLRKDYDLYGRISPDTIGRELSDYPDYKAVVLTSPTYDGVVSDIRRIAETVHSYGIPLIIDEAHGAHFGMHPAVPANAVSCGADIVIHSLHKTLPSLTQTALLHVNGTLVNRKCLKRFLRIYQSTSPSYVLMAGIDRCMIQMEQEGYLLFNKFFENLHSFHQKTKALKHLRIMRDHEEDNEEDAVTAVGNDPLKIIISTKMAHVSGNWLYHVLLDKYHLQMEMAAETYVLGIATVMDTVEGWERLADALLEIDGNLSGRNLEHSFAGEDSKIFSENLEVPQYNQRIKGLAAMTIREAWEAPNQEVMLEKSEGRIAAEFICLYPPGIPIIVPGEPFTPEIIRQILLYKEQGLKIQGLTGSNCKNVLTIL